MKSIIYKLIYVLITVIFILIGFIIHDCGGNPFFALIIMCPFIILIYTIPIMVSNIFALKRLDKKFKEIKRELS